MGFLNVSPGWVAMMCVIYYVNPLNCFWPFCAAVLCHELGHLLVLRCCGVPVRRLHLSLGGAVLETGNMAYQCEILSALAGPVTNLLLIAVWRWFPLFSVFCLFLALFNLLPILPLDGGRVLNACLLLHCSPEQTRKVLQVIAGIFCMLLVAGALWLTLRLQVGTWPILVAALLFLRVGLCVCEAQKNRL